MGFITLNNGETIHASSLPNLNKELKPYIPRKHFGLETTKEDWEKFWNDNINKAQADFINKKLNNG